MKLLFDENLAPRLSALLSDLFPGSVHVRDVGMEAMADTLVWDFAKMGGYMIVSMDMDMHDLSLIMGNPPKVIWLRIGNCSTKQVEEVMRQNFDNISLFWKTESLSLLALH